MKNQEYMHIPIEIIPNEIREEYNTNESEHNRYVYVEINKGMYVLVQEGLLENEIFAKHGFA